MIVLKIIGFVILAIFALIIAVLCVKVKIFAEYSEFDTNVKLQWLFIKIPIYPLKKKSKTEKADKKSKNAVEETRTTDVASDAAGADAADEAVIETAVDEQNDIDASEEASPQTKPKNNFLKTLYNAHGIDGLMLIVNRVFSYLGTYIGNLMHSLVIEEFYLDVRCNKNDAAETAIYYGEVCSALFPMLGALITRYKVRKYDINVYPDYLARTSSASFAVSLHLYPIYLVAITVSFGVKMLFKVLLRLIGKCFLPVNKNKEENKNKSDSVESAV